MIEVKTGFCQTDEVKLAGLPGTLEELRCFLATLRLSKISLISMVTRSEGSGFMKYLFINHYFIVISLRKTSSKFVLFINTIISNLHFDCSYN